MKSDNCILVVTENAELRHAIMTELAHRGVPALEARNAVHGMTTLTQSYPALILLDTLMSGMSGIQFCKQMIQYELTSIPVLVMYDAAQKAAVIRDLSVLRLVKKGAIQKPFSGDELAKNIQQMLGFLPQGTVAPPEPLRREPARAPTPAAQTPPPPPPKREVDDLLDTLPINPPSHSTVTQKAPGLVVQSTLDHRKPAEKPAPTPHAQAAPLGKTGYRVLVIDDDSDIRLFLKLALAENYEVAAAENGMVGLTIMEQFLPDIVICDVMMPVMNGLETVEAIRKHPKFNQIPVFFLTGEKHPDLPAAAKEAGGNLFLPKPIEPARLLHYIEYFIGESKLKPRSREVTVAEHFVGKDSPIRILAIDSNPDNVSRLKAALNQDPKSRWETVWSEEPRVALTNLGRIQPDLILYNPRQTVMEGSAFGQFLSLKKFMDQCELAFTGKQFTRDDQEYSRDHLGRDTIPLELPTEEVKAEIIKLVQAARAKFKPKKYTLDQLKAQEAAQSTSVRLREDPEQARRNREMMREQYKRIQKYIDD